MTDRQEWVTTGEAARMLGVRSINTIKRLIRDGRLIAIRPGGHYRVSRADLQRLTEGHPSASSRPAGRPDLRSRTTRQWLKEWADRHRVARVSLFGSAARGEMRPDSDIDIAVEFEEGSRVGLFEMVDMRDELVERFGRPVDLGTLRSMRPYVRRSADRDLVTLYEV
jgi:excisionase family DNA binding protein